MNILGPLSCTHEGICLCHPDIIADTPRPVTPARVGGYACCGGRPAHYPSCGEHVFIQQHTAAAMSSEGKSLGKGIWLVVSRRRDGSNVPLGVYVP